VEKVKGRENVCNMRKKLENKMIRGFPCQRIVGEIQQSGDQYEYSEDSGAIRSEITLTVACICKCFASKKSIAEDVEVPGCGDEYVLSSTTAVTCISSEI
jgi:hypothetical protein